MMKGPVIAHPVPEMLTVTTSVPELGTNLSLKLPAVPSSVEVSGSNSIVDGTSQWAAPLREQPSIRTGSSLRVRSPSMLDLGSFIVVHWVFQATPAVTPLIANVS